MKTCLNCNRSFPNKYQNCPYCGEKVGTIERNNEDVSMYMTRKLTQFLLPIVILLIGIIIFKIGLDSFNRIAVVIGVLIAVSVITYKLADFFIWGFAQSVLIAIVITLIVSSLTIFIKIPISDIPEKVAKKCFDSSYGEVKGNIEEKDRYGRMLIKYKTSTKNEIYVIIQSYKDNFIYIDENVHYDGEKVSSKNTTKGYYVISGSTTFIYKRGGFGDLETFKNDNNWDKPINGTKKVIDMKKLYYVKQYR